MRANKIKTLLREGTPAFGCFVQLSAASSVELCGLAGFDFLVIDCEHTEMDYETAAGLVRAADAVGVTPIARSALHEPQVILRYLDMGALGVQIPQIHSADQARRVVESVKYRPQGKRGLAAVRAADYLVNQGLDDYLQQANRETLVSVHIETPGALEEVEAIAAVEGVDVLFIGPTDLSYSLGYPGQPRQAQVQAAFERIIQAARDHGKTAGIMVASVEDALDYIQRGVRFVTTADRQLLVAAARQFLQGVRGASA